MNNEQNEKFEDAEKPTRNQILVNARAAKKIKKDKGQELLKEHITELANINTHINKIYEQINTIVNMMPGPKRKFDDDDIVEVPAKKVKTDVATKEEVAPMVTVEPTSYRPAFSFYVGDLIGKAVGATLAGGGLYLVRRAFEGRNKNNVHSRYDILD